MRAANRRSCAGLIEALPAALDETLDDAANRRSCAGLIEADVGRVAKDLGVTGKPAQLRRPH